MDRRISGKVMYTINEKSNMVEKLKNIELMNISNEEKDMLFILTHKTWQKEEFIRLLEIIIETGKIFPRMRGPKVIQDKIDAINNKNREDVINIAIKLKKRIENNEIVV